MRSISRLTDPLALVRHNLGQHGRGDNRERRGSPAHGTVVGHRDIHAHQFEHRAHETFGLAKSELERRAQHQAGLDRATGIPALTARRRTRNRCPLIQRVLGDPQRQTATAAKSRLVLGPVQHLVSHLRDVMPTSAVVFVWHGPW
jgi:hypothetical protein